MAVTERACTHQRDDSGGSSLNLWRTHAAHFFFLKWHILPYVLSSPAWPSFPPGAHRPSSACPGTAGLPGDSLVRQSPPTARLLSRGSSAPLNVPSRCCSLWAVNGWMNLCRMKRTGRKIWNTTHHLGHSAIASKELFNKWTKSQ